MAGRYGRRFMKDEDFDEGEVWGMMEERENNSSPTLRKPIKKDPSSLSLSPSSTTKPRMIPKSSSNISTIEAHPHQSKQFSAPLDIPDWSKIYGKSSSKKKGSCNNYNFATPSSPSWGVHHHHHHYDHDDHDGDDDDGDDDDDDDGYGVVPPHEYLAKKLARSQISSFSVYEGIGRTLKGRDLSKVRNAVLTKTGFLES